MLVGRDRETAVLTTLLDAARAGRGGVLNLVGEPGIGKSTLLAAVREAAADFTVVGTTGVEAHRGLTYAGLLDVLGPLRSHLSDLTGDRRVAVTTALGWGSEPGDQDEGDRRFLVAAATMSMLALAAARRPVLVVVDDLPWVDPGSVAALTFTARRLPHDPVAFVFAGRETPDAQLAGAGVTLHLEGLAPADAHRLLGGTVGPVVVDRLVRLTDGNPLAITELARSLTDEQRRGSAPLPPALPLGDRLASDFGRLLDGLGEAGRRAVLIAAACTEGGSGPVVGALTASGTDPATGLDEAERAGVLRVADGRVAFRHPLVRAIAWSSASGTERRAAHAALAEVYHPETPTRVWHLGEAAVGFDDALARRVLEQARRERARAGYATASALAERAARLSSSPTVAATCLADAVEDALVAGDGARVRALACAVLDVAEAGEVRARVLLALGTLEEFAGSVLRARTLLTEAAATGSGPVRLRALAELVLVSYRLAAFDEIPGMVRAALSSLGPDSPEEEMLAAYVEGAATAIAGDWAGAHRPLARAFTLLETDPVLRAEPRYLHVALLVPGWMGEPDRVTGYLDRRLAAARAVGALGVLPLALSLVAGGATALGRHREAFAYAGEAVELGEELGYVADLAISLEILCWQLAARGRHDEAREALRRARALAERAEVTTGAVQIELVDAFAALCRGDLRYVVEVLERRLQVDDGRLPRGDYPLSVVPDLVEALLGLGERERATVLAHRHIENHSASADPDVRGHARRLAGLIADDDDRADAEFAAAAAVSANPFDVARTELVHGARLRRAGRRTAARARLRIARDGFAALGLDGWVRRADQELAASGTTLRPAGGGPLTSRETQVGLLVAQGMSNREIAAALFISARTVEHHVAGALHKLDLRTRTELAVTLSR